MFKLKEFEEWFETFHRICFDVSIAAYNAKTLTSNEHREEEQKLLRHGFFQHHIYQLKFISTVQVCKLLTDNKNQKLNIFKIIRRINSESLDNNFKALVSAESLDQEDLKMLFSEILSKIDKYSYQIKKAQIARDKVYAHRDKNISHINLTWEILWDLSFLLEEVYNLINGRIFDRHMDFRTKDWDLGDIIKCYVRLKHIAFKKEK